eukprot:jgi/Bigna1/76266/fgenesh1_pg.40_\
MCEMWADNDQCKLIKRGWKQSFDNGDEIKNRLIAKLLVVVNSNSDQIDSNFTILKKVYWGRGSSTSAGHDSNFHYAYSEQAQLYMQDIFQKLGLSLSVHNVAMGGWDYRSGTMYCLENIAGPDVDLMFWEWGCFNPSICSQEVIVNDVQSH